MFFFPSKSVLYIKDKKFLKGDGRAEAGGPQVGKQSGQFNNFREMLSQNKKRTDGVTQSEGPEFCLRTKTKKTPKNITGKKARNRKY